LTPARILACLPLLAALVCAAQSPASQQVFGFRDFAQQARWDTDFLAIPDARLAGEHLRILTAEPHWASSPEDYKTALYVADKFKAAGLETTIVPYKVLLNKPAGILVEAFDSSGKKLMSGPSREHVDPTKYGGDPGQNDPRILPAFNGFSPSGDVTAPVVYANYGTLADFKKLASLGVSVKGKIVLVRYGANFRGVKVYIAQRYGAKGVLIYSDPADDGYFRGDPYPKGPYHPATAVQRGSVQFLPIYPGDPETPGIASTPDLPDSERTHNPVDLPAIPSNPLSYKDAAPILKALDGPRVPHGWQGALPFAYHLGGTASVTVHMHLQQDYALRTIWDVIGTVDGTDPAQKDDCVIAGNHRDAWVYGAVDPNSGTAAMLEAVHGIGGLLRQGWRPRRRIVFASWDAEEEGLIGSTEWVEQHIGHLAHAVAYFNTDVAVSGPNFNAAAIPSLKQFVREVTTQVPSPKGGTVYLHWKKPEDTHPEGQGPGHQPADAAIAFIDNLGSGSDYTPFLQHAGVPSTDIGSSGPYGVYHSTFDDYNWFIKFADPTFVYEQEMARVFGLEVLHMADADVLPYDYQLYGKAILGYIEAAQRHADHAGLKLDFTAAMAAAQRFAAAGSAVRAIQLNPPADTAALNQSLRAVEEDFLAPTGLPHRPWYKHLIYAPGEYTGYEAIVIPGVNEAIAANDASRAQSQLSALSEALNRAAVTLESATRPPSK
jgi:N-acetylated-alpha-linked acidic dipeptidase